MALYQVYKLDNPSDENSSGVFVKMVVVDSGVDVIGKYGNGEGFGEDGILYQWNPPDGHVAVKHPDGENQPEFGAPLIAPADEV